MPTTGSPQVSDGRSAMEIQAPARSLRRYRLVRTFAVSVARLYSRVRVEGIDRLPDGPIIVCFSHQNWLDPMYLLAAMPGSPRIHFFGPEENDMRVGTRNRLMRWAGLVVPFRIGRRGLVAATSRAAELTASGSTIAIAGEGRIHCGERLVMPLADGPAYLSLRSGVPLVPVAINGTSWLGFRRVVRVRIGLPIDVTADVPHRPSAAEVRVLTSRAQVALETLVADFPDQPRPGPVGCWLTELFNAWSEGSRPC